MVMALAESASVKGSFNSIDRDRKILIFDAESTLKSNYEAQSLKDDTLPWEINVIKLLLN